MCLQSGKNKTSETWRIGWVSSRDEGEEERRGDNCRDDWWWEVGGLSMTTWRNRVLSMMDHGAECGLFLQIRWTFSFSFASKFTSVLRLSPSTNTNFFWDDPPKGLKGMTLERFHFILSRDARVMDLTVWTLMCTFFSSIQYGSGIGDLE